MEANRFQSLTKEDSFETQQLFMQIREDFEGRPDELIPVLQKAQKKLGYLPENVLLEIARFTKLSAATVFGVATFFEQFRFHPIGKHTIRVCRGTAIASRLLPSPRTTHDQAKRWALLPGQSDEASNRRPAALGYAGRSACSIIERTLRLDGPSTNPNWGWTG